jgi:hypothetical protein
MKKKVSNLIIIVVTIILIAILYGGYRYYNKEHFEGCEKSQGYSSDPMPELAAEACKKISTKAEEIEAHYNGIANIVSSIPVLNLFSPSSYSSGDNKTSDMMRNIINTNLSKCEVEQISNSCSTIATSIQSNIIDTSGCDYCNKVDPRACIISGNVQVNNSATLQTCSIKLAIKMLSEKKSSIDAQALSKVLQKCEGIISGNNISASEKCNIISQDLSTKSYLEQKNECLNSLNLDQQNILKGCAFIDNVQKNISKNIQQCIIGIESIKQDTIESNTTLKNESSSEQKSTGIDALAMFLSSMTSLISSSIVTVILYMISTFDFEQFKEE